MLVVRTDGVDASTCVAGLPAVLGRTPGRGDAGGTSRTVRGTAPPAPGYRRGVPILHRVEPILNVHDVAASLDYYVDRLGFTCTFTWGEPATFAGVARDGAALMLCQDGQGQPGTWLSIWVDDVDSLHDELRERGADIRHEPVDLSWGVREMNVADLDGHRIRFCTPSGRDAPPVDDPFGA